MKSGFCTVQILSQAECTTHSETAAKESVPRWLVLQRAGRCLAAFNKMVRTTAKKIKIGQKL